MKGNKRTRVIMERDPLELVYTKQSMKNECDINKIMEKYRNGGEIQHVNRAQAQYGDFSSGVDFTRAYTAIAKAEGAFAELPAHIRDLFGNDPEVFSLQNGRRRLPRKTHKTGRIRPGGRPGRKHSQKYSRTGRGAVTWKPGSTRESTERCVNHGFAESAKPHV